MTPGIWSKEGSTLALKVLEILGSTDSKFMIYGILYNKFTGEFLEQVHSVNKRHFMKKVREL